MKVSNCCLDRRAVAPVLALLALPAIGCASSKVDDPHGSGGGSDAGQAGSGTIQPGEGVVELSIAPDRLTFVELSAPTAVEVSDDGGASLAWDLALRGRDVFTNGGISGPGNGAAFGPLSPPTFLSDTAPDVPILLKDRAGGALVDWYDYGGDQHQLFSRYHVYGLRDGDRYFKVQVLSYYGERLGEPVSALYRVRYAEVLADAVGETRETAGIDATAGNDSADDSQLSACLNLDTERVSELTPAQASDSDDWHLCFRREAIAVNGGLSGPRGVEAVDLQGDQTAHETPEQVQARTEDSELPAFDEVDYATLSADGLSWAADGVVTAFARRWLEAGSDPLALSDTVWLVLAADGASKYLMKFESLRGDLGNDTATVSVRAKAVR
jgi:hypothetical protein